VERRVVQLFVTCLVDAFYPNVGAATVELLERLGWTVEFPWDQTCCGQPAFNAGFTTEARKMAVHTLEVLDATDGPIVLPSGSCAEMIVHHIPGLVADQPALAARAERVAARTRELTSFLVDELGVTDVGATASGTVTYHPSCHGLRGLGLTHQPQALIDAVAGAERVELPDATECCGFGGLFSVKMPDVSGAMLTTKLDNVEASGADTLVGGDVSCLMHMEGGLRKRGSSMRVCHIAELLAGRTE
jgi:L-lactate dehydrogenase complex protein LldE